MTFRVNRAVRRLGVLGVLGVLACQESSVDPAKEREAILALVARAGEAHLDRDAAEFLAAVDSGWWAASNGRWSYRTKVAALPGIAEYFRQTTFHALTEVAPPDLHISEDGRMAWLRGEVEITATERDSTGITHPVRFRAAWLDVYEKRDGHWSLAARANTQLDLP